MSDSEKGSGDEEEVKIKEPEVELLDLKEGEFYPDNYQVNF